MKNRSFLSAYIGLLGALLSTANGQTGLDQALPWETSVEAKWAAASLPAFPPPRPKPARIMLRKVFTDQPCVAMTFDDGPHPKNTPRLLDMLKERGIRGTFFLIGELVKTYPKITQRIVAEGHEIGNHTFFHKYFIHQPDDLVLKHLQLCHDAMVEVAGVAPKIMRPPGELIRPAQTQMIFDQFGYPDIRWSVDPGDARLPMPSASTIAARILAQAHNGAIILSHDIKVQTVDAMPRALDGLAAKGFQFVTVSELLAMDKPAAAAAELRIEPAELEAWLSPSASPANGSP